jgi:hypothetical protein
LTLFTHSAEAGQTSGTTVTTGNSATGGDAFTSVVSNMTYDNTNVAHGSMGFKCTAAASTSTYMDWVNISGSSTTLGFAPPLLRLHSDAADRERAAAAVSAARHLLGGHRPSPARDDRHRLPPVLHR